MSGVRPVAVSAARWVALTAVSVAGWFALDAVGLTAPSLFAALVVAVVFALTGVGPRAVPRAGSMVAQGTLAVTIGLMVDVETLSALGDNWFPAVAIGVAAGDDPETCLASVTRAWETVAPTLPSDARHG